MERSSHQCELRSERISNSAVLDITEVNGFKKLVHLSIRLNQADEGNVRKNMITTLTRLKVTPITTRIFAFPAMRVSCQGCHRDAGFPRYINNNIFQNDKDRLEDTLRSSDAKFLEQQSKYERQLESQRLQIEKMKTDFEHDMNQLRSRVSLEMRRDTDGLNRVSALPSQNLHHTALSLRRGFGTRFRI